MNFLTFDKSMELYNHYQNQYTPPPKSLHAAPLYLTRMKYFLMQFVYSASS